MLCGLSVRIGITVCKHAHSMCQGLSVSTLLIIVLFSPSVCLSFADNIINNRVSSFSYCLHYFFLHRLLLLLGIHTYYK